jgi:GT2 family glycosyltransferase
MGAAILGSRGAVDRIGGWDPTFFLYYEDKDICLRSWRADAPVLLVPDARWVHEWARETTGFRWAPWRREIASMARFYSRYPEFLTTRARSRRAHPDIDAAVFGARV